MADLPTKRIKDFTAVSPLVDDHSFPVDPTSGTTRRVRADVVAAYVDSKLGVTAGLNAAQVAVEAEATARASAISAESAARADGDAETLESAQGYADTKAGEALEAALESAPLVAAQQIDARLADTPTAIAGINATELLTPETGKASIIANAEYADFTPALPATYTRPFGERMREHRSVLDWFSNYSQRLAILAGTATADATVQMQAAFASGENLFAPRGRYNIADELAMSRQQQSVVGQNKADTRFVIQADANLFANSFIKATHYGTFKGFTFSFIQNAATVSGNRADLVQYPWAVDLRSATQFNMSDLYIERAWLGVNGKGNIGGLKSNEIKICAFDTGIDVDGALHHVEIKGWDHWCYGATSGPLKTIYDDGLGYAGKFGRADVFEIFGFKTFKAKVKFYEGTGGAAIGQIHGLQLDGDNAEVEFDAASGNLDVIGGYASKSNIPTTSQWLHKAGICRVSGFRMQTSAPGGNVKVDGGTLHISQSDILQAKNDAVSIEQTGGNLSLVDVDVRVNNTVARSQPVFKRSGGSTIISALRPSLKGVGGSGNLVEISNDHARDQIDLGDTGGWGIVLPTGAITGRYTAGKRETFAAGVGFQTPGTTPITPTQNGCSILRKGDVYRFACTILFPIISSDITGAAGPFRIGPLPITPVEVQPVVISQLAAVGWNAAHEITAELSTDGYIYFRTQASAGGIGTMGTAEFAARAGYILRFGCEFLARNV